MNYLKTGHSILKSTVGIDMDLIQASVLESLPAVDLQRGVIFTAQTVVFWGVIFLV